MAPPLLIGCTALCLPDPSSVSRARQSDDLSLSYIAIASCLAPLFLCRAARLVLCHRVRYPISPRNRSSREIEHALVALVGFEVLCSAGLLHAPASSVLPLPLAHTLPHHMAAPGVAPRALVFCEPVPEALKCLHCQQAFTDAVMCLFCNAIFCRECLSVANANRCSRCSRVLEAAQNQIVPMAPLTQLASLLRVFCPNSDTGGCSWSGERQHVAAHLSECEQRTAQCEHCGEARTAAWLAQHRDRCGRRLVACGVCDRLDVQARCLAFHRAERCVRRSLEARVEYAERTVACLLARLALAVPAMATCARDVADELCTESREVERRWADEHEREWAFEFALGSGTPGSAPGQLSTPLAVAVDPLDGRVLVTDSNNHRVQVFARDGHLLAALGSRGSGDDQFNLPIGIAVDASHDGRIVVADSHNHRVQVLSRAPTPEFKFEFGTHGSRDGQFSRPYGIAIDRQRRIVVADSHNHRIQVFSSDGRFLFKFGTHGGAESYFTLPSGVAIDPLDGNIVVADNENHRIQVFASDGRYLFAFGTNGTGDGQFRYPWGVAIDQHGRMFVADCVNDRVQMFARDGSFLAKYGTQGSADGHFMHPWGMAIDLDGCLVVADTRNHRVQVIRPPTI